MSPQAIREQGTGLCSVVLNQVTFTPHAVPMDWVSPPVRGFGGISPWGNAKQSRECALQVLASEINHEAGEKGLEQRLSHQPGPQETSPSFQHFTAPKGSGREKRKPTLFKERETHTQAWAQELRPFHLDEI